MQNNITGVFILKREFGNNVSLLNTKTNSLEYIDYFKFKQILERSYGIERSNKILENINCYNKVILDFEKNVAKLIKDKDFDFKKVISGYMTPEHVENEYSCSLFYDDDIQGRFQTL